MISVDYFVVILLCLQFWTSREAELSRLGQDPETIVPSRAGLRSLFADDSTDVRSDTVFVTREAFKDDGLFFAFTANWIGAEPFRVQIWRPTSDAVGLDRDGTLDFVGDLEISADVVNATNTVYFASLLAQKCIMVQKGDRIGFRILAGSVSPFSIIYDETLENSTILVATGDIGNGSQTLNFSKIRFPYKMNFIAYLLIDSSKSTNEVQLDCPRHESVESFTTTTPALVRGDLGPPGDAGETGAMGAFGPVGGHGHTGPTGPTGPSGAVGPIGDTGGTGFTGPIGFQGDTGETGIKGPVGDMGIDGDQGDTGAPGKDGVPGHLIYVNFTDNSSDFLALVQDLPSYLTWKDSVWKSERYMIGLLIWFALLSLLTIIFLFVVVFLCAKVGARFGSGASQNSWNTFGTSDGSDLEFARSAKSSTLESRSEPVIRVDEGMDTLRVFANDENLRALREDTFKELTNETIPMY